MVERRVARRRGRRCSRAPGGRRRSPGGSRPSVCIARERNQIDRSPVRPWIKTTSGPAPACWTWKTRPFAGSGAWPGSRSGSMAAAAVGLAEVDAEEVDQLADGQVALAPCGPGRPSARRTASAGRSAAGCASPSTTASIDARPEVGEEPRLAIDRDDRIDPQRRRGRRICSSARIRTRRRPSHDAPALSPSVQAQTCSPRRAVLTFRNSLARPPAGLLTSTTMRAGFGLGRSYLGLIGGPAGSDPDRLGGRLPGREEPRHPFPSATRPAIASREPARPRRGGSLATARANRAPARRRSRPGAGAASRQRDGQTLGVGDRDRGQIGDRRAGPGR